jgi:hypothetical protein
LAPQTSRIVNEVHFGGCTPYISRVKRGLRIRLGLDWINNKYPLGGVTAVWNPLKLPNASDLKVASMQTLIGSSCWLPASSTLDQRYLLDVWTDVEAIFRTLLDAKLAHRRLKRSIF